MGGARRWLECRAVAAKAEAARQDERGSRNVAKASKGGRRLNFSLSLSLSLSLSAVGVLRGPRSRLTDTAKGKDLPAAANSVIGLIQPPGPASTRLASARVEWRPSLGP